MVVTSCSDIRRQPYTGKPLDEMTSDAGGPVRGFHPQSFA